MSASDWQGQARPAFRTESAADLRDLIAQAELVVGNLRGAGPRAVTLLYLLDAIHDLVPSLKSVGVDLRAEAVRIETVEGLLQAKDATLVAEVRRLGGLAAAREAEKREPGHWWWYLDQHLAARRAQRLRRALLIAGGVVAALLLLTAGYRLLFPPDPQRMAALEKQTEAEQLVISGDLAGAAECYRQAVEIMPDEPEYQVWLGVLEQQQGHAEAAAAAFARAEALEPDRARFLVMRGMAWLQLDALDEAEADGKAALASEPESAEAYLLLGGVYERRGDTRAAIDAFEQAGNLAEAAGNDALTVMARTRLGMLLQSGPIGPAPSESP